MKNFFGLSLLIFAVSCMSAKIKTVNKDLTDTFTKADLIYVSAFSATKTQITGHDSKNTEVTSNDKSKITDTFNEKVAAQLRDKGFNATTNSNDKDKAKFLVTGDVSQINHGNPHLRFWIGFGSGKSTMDTTVKIMKNMKGKTTEVSKFDVAATSGFTGGFNSWRNFTDNHIEDSSKSIANYFKTKAQ